MSELTYTELLDIIQEYKLEHKLDVEKNIWISTEPIEVFESKRLII